MKERWWANMSPLRAPDRAGVLEEHWMTPTFGTWSIESSTAKMNMAAAGMLVLGVALALGPDGVEGSGLALSRAAFVLGSLLIVVGTGVLLLGGKQVVIVDTRARRMVLQSKGRFRHTERFIPFDEISQVSVCEHGDSEGGSTRYYVAVKLRSQAARSHCSSAFL